MQENDRKKVVNTEEQNEPVNPRDRMDEETVTTKEEQVNSEERSPGQNEKTERESEAERPHHIEGDDAATGIDRKIPKL